VAGVKLNNNTATEQSERRFKKSKPVEFSRKKNYENEERITEKLAKLWLEWNSTTTQKALNLSNFRETLRK
jgi:hypothetical protein